MIKRPVCAMVVAFLLFQLFCVWCFPEKLETPLQNAEGDTITCVGTVGRREETKDYHIYYLKEIQKAPCLEQISDFQLLIYVKKDTENTPYLLTQVGNVAEFTGRLQTFASASNPGMFDQRLYYYKQDILASLWAENIKILDSRENVLLEQITLFRLECQSQLVRVLGERNGQFLSAMLLGDKRDMDQELKELYQLSGIGHVLAISGLHMSFLGNGVYQFLRKRGCSFWFSGLSGILFLGMYSLLTGGSVSCTRAMIMYVVRMGAEITGRTYDQMTSLAIAAGCTGIRQPLYLSDAGFLLSYGAILGIIIFQPVFENVQNSFKTKSKILQVLQSGICSSLSIQITVLPVLLYFYFEFPVYSIVLNLFVIPLMSVVMAAGLLGVIVLVTSFAVFPVLEQAGSWILHISGLILDFYERCVEISVQLPFSRWIAGQPKWWQICMYYLVLAVLLWRWKKKSFEENRKARFVCMFVYALSVLALIFDYTDFGVMKTTMLDVGQGACFIIQSPEGAAFMVDGGSSDISSIGKYRIEPYLKSQGISKLDYVFVTHGDLDHTSGILEMLQREKTGLSIEKLVFPCYETWDESLYELAGAAQTAGIPVVTIQPGNKLVSGNMILRCLQPAPEDELETGNMSSMILELEYGNFDMLLTGDVEAEGERLLMERMEEKQYEILQVAHHGSKNSSSIEFLEIVQPQAALISAGKNNFYGHPHEETLERLELIGSSVYTTKDDGAVTVAVKNDRIVIERYTASEGICLNAVNKKPSGFKCDNLNPDGSYILMLDQLISNRYNEYFHAHIIGDSAGFYSFFQTRAFFHDRNQLCCLEASGLIHIFAGSKRMNSGFGSDFLFVITLFHQFLDLKQKTEFSGQHKQDTHWRFF